MFKEIILNFWLKLRVLVWAFYLSYFTMCFSIRMHEFKLNVAILKNREKKKSKIMKRIESIFWAIKDGWMRNLAFLKRCLFINRRYTVISIPIRQIPIMPIFCEVIGSAWFCEKLGINIRFHFIECDNIFENSEIMFSGKHQNKNSAIFKINFHAINHGYTKSGISSDYGQKIIAKLIIKQKLQQQAKQWINDNLHGNWIGVHYRGTDALYTVKHRYMEIEKYIACLREVLDTQCNIFACSDQEQFIEQIHAVFPGRVFSQDIIRSRDKTPLHKGSKYAGCQQREDALTDLLILSKASLVYTPGSYFVDAVRFLNPAIKIISLDGREVCYKNIPNYISTPRKIRSRIQSEI